ncbi:MAG: DeoR family transcriptional regulator [Gammaproteobacteria bacterium]|nr:DeoR family transcriptional regulator [Gammaproteobacteria bacterium]
MPDTSRNTSVDARQNELLAIVRQRGYVSIEAMANRFAVSTQTIRRDIKTLSGQKLLERHHGGAGLPPGTDTLAYTSRKVRHALEKQLIGRLVARQIPNGASLFIDIGTTTEAVAEALVNHRELRVVTNHIGVASMLSEHTDFEIVLTGGRVRKRDQAVTGEASADFLQRFKVTYGIFGIGTIDSDGDLLDYDYRDVQVSCTAIANSRKRFIVMDKSKFYGDAMIKVGHLRQVDALFTDGPPPADVQRLLRANKVKLHVPMRRRADAPPGDGAR